MRGWIRTGAALTAVLVGCASDAPQASQDETSELALRLTLPGGEQIDSVSYVVSGGPSGITRNGSMDVRNSSELRFQIGRLPVSPTPEAAYVINLSALTGSGASCAGSAMFVVPGDQVAQLAMTLTCSQGSSNESDTTGDLRVSGSISLQPGLSCPVVTGITALPTQGNLSMQVEGFVSSAPDSVSWSASAGTFANGSGATTTYICASAGSVDLNFSVQKAGCPASLYGATVTCEAPDARGLLWNEIESNGGTPDDWVELYNAGSQPVDLTGWTFRDNDNTHIYAIPAGTTIAASGYLVLENFGFGLGSPDEARLFNAAGQLVLSYGWSPHAPTTYGRCPNVTGALATTSASTKGAANDCTPLLRINEVESDGGSPGDWIEIVNAGFNSADLAGYRLSDNSDASYTFPAGVTLAPGAYLAVDTVTFGFGLGGGDSVELYDPTNVLVDSYTWPAHAPTTYGRCPDSNGSFAITAVATKGTANDCAALPGVIRINEVESNGGSPGDWVELYNPGSSSVDMSGWVFRDANESPFYTLPAGSVIPAGGYFLLEEAAFGFGLGGSESARLFNGTTLVDSYVWTAHAGTTYGRCPNGTGNFITTASVTKGTANDCGGSVVSPWPGGAAVQTVDPTNTYTSNLSGLHYQPANGSAGAVLWAVLNGPGTLYRLVQSGVQWLSDGGTWAGGRVLKYPDGTGNVDAEGVTKADWNETGIYVASERNNDDNSVSRLSVLRFDESSAATPLVATHEWNLTALLPAAGPNLGLEAVTWLPDSYLVARGFRDALLNKVYAPADYPDHGTGLFAVGVEATGNVHVLALNHTTSTASLIATFSSQLAGVMDLEFDRDLGIVWVTCDNTCNNQSTLFAIDEGASSPTRGLFVLRSRIGPPSGLPNSNNEGFTFQSNAQCVSGQKAAFWSDDSNIDTHALRQGTLSCTPPF